MRRTARAPRAPPPHEVMRILSSYLVAPQKKVQLGPLRWRCCEKRASGKLPRTSEKRHLTPHYANCSADVRPYKCEEATSPVSIRRLDDPAGSRGRLGNRLHDRARRTGRC